MGSRCVQFGVMLSLSHTDLLTCKQNYVSIQAILASSAIYASGGAGTNCERDVILT